MIGEEPGYLRALPGLSSESALWENRHESTARIELTRRYLPLAASVVINHDSDPGLSEDVYSQARGLLQEAIERFDPRTDRPFVEFAPKFIEAEIRRSPGRT